MLAGAVVVILDQAEQMEPGVLAAAAQRERAAQGKLGLPVR